MLPIKNLKLSILYTDELAGTWTCGQLAQGKGVILSSELEMDAFYDVRGGLKATTDRVFTFLYTTDGFDLIGYVRFLIASLIEGQNPTPTLAHFKNEVIGSPDIIAVVINQDLGRLVLRHAAQVWALDFVDPLGEAPDDPESPFFQNILIQPETWRQAARIALIEYKIVLEQLEEFSGESLQSQEFLREIYRAIKELT